jgi:toxin HigB-1
MIQSVKYSGSEDIFNGKDSRLARRVCPMTLWKQAQRKLDLLDSVVRLEELQIPPGNRLEVLKGDRKGQFSIRINAQYRVCFVWTDAGPDEVEIVDYHR